MKLKIDRQLDEIIGGLTLGFLRAGLKRDPGWRIFKDRLFDNTRVTFEAQAAALDKLHTECSVGTLDEYLKQAGEFFGWSVTESFNVKDMRMPAARCKMNLYPRTDRFDMTLYVVSRIEELDACAADAPHDSAKHIAVLFLPDSVSQLSAFHIIGRRIIRLPVGLMLAVAASRKPKKRFADEILKQGDLELLSPYQPEGTTPRGMFHGRITELEMLRIRDTTSFAIYGPRRIGKTSLVLQARALIDEQQRSPRLTGFVDVAIARTADDCLRLIANEFNLDWSPGQSLLEFQEAAGRAKASLNANMPFVLIIDEIDRVIAKVPDSEEFFGVLRALHNNRIMRTIVCGFRTLRRAATLDSPLFNWFQRIELGNLDDAAARELVKGPMTNLGVSFDPAAADTIPKAVIGRASTHPGTVQFFCHELLKLLNKTSERTITKDHVEEVAKSRPLADYVLAGLRELGECETNVLLNHSVTGEAPLSQIVRNCAHVMTRAEVEEAVDSLVDYLILAEVPDSHPKRYRYTQPLIPVLLKRRATV
ncbi:MAG: ATP-binding protein [Planctomycetia bacterium]|nr:ATP-binding protein [Planctomycetia bacterium]